MLLTSTCWWTAATSGQTLSFLQLVLGSNGPRNFLGYANSTVDGLLAQGRAAVDHAVRGPAYREALRILAHELPRVPCSMQHPIHVGYRTDWVGWSWDDTVRGTLPFWSFERVRPRAEVPEFPPDAHAGRSAANMQGVD